MVAREAPVIDAFALASERGAIRGELPLSRLPRLAGMLLDRSGVLTYAIEGRIDDQGHPGATMQLQADLVLSCQRCNSPVAFRLDRTAAFRFAASEDELASRPIEDDEFEDIVASHHFEVAPWVEDEAILSLPVAPRHDSCRPPTSASASPENEASRERDPHPFAVLAGFKPGRRAN
jgi:DUF177 domain-containing protein